MIIRKVKKADAEPLVRLAEVLGHALDIDRLSQDMATYALGFYIAESSDGIAGYLIMRTEHPPTCVRGQSPIQLWRLFVSPEHQGKGVAASLTAKAMADARESAHDVVWLGTSQDNARAIAFYRKSGFSPVGVAELHQGHDAHQDLIMLRDLQ